MATYSLNEFNGIRREHLHKRSGRKLRKPMDSEKMSSQEHPDDKNFTIKVKCKINSYYKIPRYHRSTVIRAKARKELYCATLAYKNENFYV